MRSTFVACVLASLWLAAPGAAQAEVRGDLRAAIASAKERIYPALVNIQVVAQEFGGGRAVRSLRANHAKFITRPVHSDVRWGTQDIEPAFIAVMNSDLEGTVRKQLGTAFTPTSEYGSGEPWLRTCSRPQLDS